MNYLKALPAAVVGFGLLCPGCTAVNGQPQGEMTHMDKDLAGAQTAFAARMYGAAAGARDGNLFLSPLSIATAFAMARAGARGDTAAEMDRAFAFPAEDASRDAFFASAARRLNTPSEDYALALANALWVQQGQSFQRDYTTVLERQYGAPLQALDFTSQPERSRRRINGWVEDQTQDRITDLIPDGAITPATRVVLTNAIYFKGTWLHTFRERSTRDKPFYPLGGAQATVPMMQQAGHFGYCEDDKLQVLEMVYKGGDLSMVVVLPRARDGLPELEQELTATFLEDRLKRLAGRRVLVSLPRFRIELGFGLRDMLRDLGVVCAFDPERADFSGITGDRSLFLSAAIHKAFVEVNERGTEAAAATAVMMEATAMPAEPPPAFVADHPFLFLIRDRRSGLVLFIGRLMAP